MEFYFYYCTKYSKDDRKCYSQFKWLQSLGTKTMINSYNNGTKTMEKNSSSHIIQITGNNTKRFFCISLLMQE